MKAFNSASLYGLKDEDLQRLNTLGLKVGSNPTSNNNKIWIGNDGYMRLTFYNWKNERLILCLWHGDAGFLNTQTPEITITLEPFKSVTISAANNVKHNAFSVIYRNTKVAGQIYNTWGEFSTEGTSSTINVSRLPFMRGNEMIIKSHQNGCVTNMDTCAFVCKNNRERCGESQEYDLINCDPAKGGSWHMADFGKGLNPEGGCMMGDGGDIDVSIAERKT
jgi:hypothetical protein